MRFRRFVALGAVLSAAAAAPPPGAVECSGCHGKGPQPPALTGRVPEEIVVALDAFRAGTKQATVMDRIAKGFTDTEIAAIADWYAQQKP